MITQKKLMKKLLLLGCMPWSCGLFGMEALEEQGVLFAPQTPIVQYADQAIVLLAQGAVGRYNEVLKKHPEVTLEVRELAFAAYKSCFKLVPKDVAAKVSDEIADRVGPDIFAYHIIYLSQHTFKDDSARQKQAYRVYFKDLGADAREKVLKFFAQGSNELAFNLIDLLDDEQLAEYGLFIRNSKLQGEFIKRIKNALIKILEGHYEEKINKSQPIAQFDKKLMGTVETLMTTHVRLDEENSFALLFKYLDDLTLADRKAFLECLVIGYACSEIKKAAIIEIFLTEFSDSSSDLIPAAQMLLNLYELFDRTYPQTHALLNSYAAYIDPRTKILGALILRVTTCQSARLEDLLLKASAETQLERVQLLRNEAKNVEIPQDLRGMILLAVLRPDDASSKLCQSENKEAYLAAAIEVLLPHFLEEADFPVFLQVVTRCNGLNIKTGIFDLVSKALITMVAPDKLDEYKRYIDKFR